MMTQEQKDALITKLAFEYCLPDSEQVYLLSEIEEVVAECVDSAIKAERKRIMEELDDALCQVPLTFTDRIEMVLIVEEKN